MSRRRKRKKLNSLDNRDRDKMKDDAPSEAKPELPSYPSSPPTKTSSKTSEIQPLPTNPITNQLDLDDELELDLSGDFDDDEPATTESRPALPSGDNKREMRPIRRAAEPVEPDTSSEDPLEPQKRQRTVKPSTKTAPHEDELGDLDDDLDEIPSPLPESQKKEKVTDEAQSAPEVVNSSETKEEASSDVEKVSCRSLIKNALGSLTLVEQASIGILTITLIAAAFWSTSVVFARIPNTIIASKLKFPLKGESVVLASYESYWRSPIREGENFDEGVSESIEIIPVVKITLHPQSKAKSLRFLFRDEEGRYVGDSSTVKISGATFLPSENVTSVTKGNTAIVRSTTGFEQEGELISYLADEKFQWEVVILESKDGIEYTEFMAIPISANRKNNS